MATYWTINKGKGKGVPVYAMKTCRGSRGAAQFVYNLGAGWRWVINVMLRLPYR